MSALTSLLARDHVIPVRKIEEALQRQVISGGDIETVLLELELIEEDVLSAYRAALYGLLPATRDEVMRAPRDAIRAVPPDLAARARLVPLSVEGQTLVGAVATPLTPELGKELSDRLKCDLIQRVCTEARLAAGLTHHYGLDLEPRVRRLTDALRKRDPGVIPYVRPPREEQLQSQPPARTGDTKPLAPEFDRDKPSESAYPRPSPPALSTTPAPAGLGRLSEPPASPEQAHRPSGIGDVKIPQAPATPAAQTATERASTAPPDGVSNDMARAVRGPIDLPRAQQLLEGSSSRDDVLFATMCYARQFFEFVAVFVVKKDGALGRMSHGGGLSRELIQQVQFPGEGAGLFARAIRERRPASGDLSAAEEEQSAAAVLGRPSGSPGVVFPVVLGPRVVLAIYADREGEPISTEDLEPLQDLMPMVITAIRRLILEKKAMSHVGPLPTAPGESALPNGAVEVSRPKHEDGAAPDSGPPSADQGRGATHLGIAPVVAPAPSNDAHPAAAVQPIDSLAAPAPSVPAAVATAPSQVDALDPPVTGAPPQQHPDVGASAGLAPTPEEEELARGRVLGVPRSAPPPPVRESLPPEQAMSPDGTYSMHRERPDKRESGAPEHQGESADAVAAAEPAVSEEALAVDVEVPEAAPANGAGASNGASAAPRSSITNLPVAAGPSVIIDMGENVSELVDALANARPGDEPPELMSLLQLGEAALPELLQRFPGPLWFDRQQPHKHVPRGRDLSSIAHALVTFGERAAPYVASKISNSQGDDCFYALMVAGEIPHPDLLDSVARRMFDADEGIRRLAVEMLKGYRTLAQFQIVIDALGQLSARPGKDPGRQLLSVRLLGELRDERGLPILISRLEDGPSDIKQNAYEALVILTCQDFGQDVVVWRQWQAQWGDRHRAEWLMEALLHQDEPTRSRAGDELKQMTQQYFGFHPALPKRDREVAQRKYREWWDREGRVLFQAS